MKATVIVLAWNGASYLPACLNALLAQTAPPHWQVEFLVVDNASTDASCDIVRGYAPQVQLIANTHNLGFSGGNNVGIAAAGDANVVILLNQDTEVRPGWLAAMLETFALDERIGIVGCKALYPDGRIQHAGGWVNPDDAFTGHFGQGEPDQQQYDELRDVDYVTGASIAIHANVLAEVGHLDNGFNPAYYEETDLCFRARYANFRVVYQPRAMMIHHEQTTLGHASQYKYRSVMFHTNRLRFLLKHWSSEQLIRYMAKEAGIVQDVVGEEVDAIARARAYFRNATAWHEIYVFRKKHHTEPKNSFFYEKVLNFLMKMRLIALRKLQQIILSKPSEEISEALQPAKSETSGVVSGISVSAQTAKIDFDKSTTSLREASDAEQKGYNANDATSPQKRPSIVEEEALIFFEDKFKKLALFPKRDISYDEYNENFSGQKIPLLSNIVSWIRKIFINTIMKPYVSPFFQSQWRHNKDQSSWLSEVLGFIKELSDYQIKLIRWMETISEERLQRIEQRSNTRLAILEKRWLFYDEALEIVLISDDDLLRYWLLEQRV